MRIIAGSRRRLSLCTVQGMQVRPTTDRIKETLFNILQPSIPFCSFLDLFSGSGAIALEALSRGAKEAVLVEQDKEALACIRKNIETTKFEQEASVIAGDVLTVLRTLKHKPFDIIFMDPPYRQGFEERVLSILQNSGLADENTMIIVEAAADTSLLCASELGFTVVRVKSYGSNQHFFLEKRKQ